MKGSREATDVLVVGGGIVGAACLEACVTAGLSARLIEQDRIGSGTTSAGMGHVVVLPGELLPLLRYSQQLWRARGSDWVGPVSIRAAGTIWLARDEEERGQLVRLERAFTDAKVAVQRLHGDELHRQEPALAPAVLDGLWVTDDLVVDPVASATRLVGLAQARKAEVMEGMRVETIVEGGVRLAEGTTVRARQVVIASGVESARLLPELGIFPRKGHLLHLATPNGYVRSQLGEVGYALAMGSGNPKSVAFNAHPALSGGLWLGASRQNGVASEEVEEAVVDRLLARARDYLASPPAFPVVRRWTGFRPASPDHRPFIGRWPGRDDLLVAAGHEGLGVTASLATGRLIADIVSGRRSEIDRTPFALEGRLAVPAAASRKPAAGHAAPARR